MQHYFYGYTHWYSNRPWWMNKYWDPVTIGGVYGFDSDDEEDVTCPEYVYTQSKQAAATPHIPRR